MAEPLKTIGKIKRISDIQQITDTFKKREFVIETDEQYPQKISFQFTQDRTSILDNYSVGQKVEIDYNLRGREWTNPEGVLKYFNTIEGWRIKSLEQASPLSESQSETTTEGDDDLPF